MQKDDKQQHSQDRLAGLTSGEKPQAEHAQAYSDFVRKMRKILPLLLALILAVLFTWPQLNNALPDFKALNVDIDLQRAENLLVSPRYSSRDNDLRPYVVTAQTAQFQSNKPDSIHLNQPQGEIEISEGSLIRISAQKGLYDQKAKTLDLKEDVTIVHWNGFVMETSELYFDLSSADARSRGAVHLYSPQMDLKAQSLNIKNESRLIRFIGPAELTLFLDNTKQDAGESHEN